MGRRRMQRLSRWRNVEAFHLLLKGIAKLYLCLFIFIYPIPEVRWGECSWKWWMFVAVSRGERLPITSCFGYRIALSVALAWEIWRYERRRIAISLDRSNGRWWEERNGWRWGWKLNTRTCLGLVRFGQKIDLQVCTSLDRIRDISDVYR